jgi:hypothetical protein
MKISNKVYDNLVILVEISLPCAAAIMVLFGDTFGIPFANTVGGFIAGCAAIIGVYLKQARKLYADLKYDDDADEEARDDIEVKAEEVTE